MTPVVEWRGATDAHAPLVVLLHGRGSDEHGMLDLLDHLPDGAAVAAVRGPLPFGDGYSWFEFDGVGLPDAGSLAAQTRWFRDWLDAVAPAPRPVMLIGFSGGAVFAAALALEDPARYAGVAILYGPVPMATGLATPDRWAGLNVFHAQATEDTVVPRELMDATWTYVSRDAGANAVTHRHPGGHQISPEVERSLEFWVAHHLPGLGVTN